MKIRGPSRPCKSVNSWTLSAIENPQFLMCAMPQMANAQIFMIKPQIANPQVYTKYCTILSVSLTSPFILYSIWKEKKLVFPDEVLSPRKKHGPHITNPQITNPQIINHKSSAYLKSKCHIYGKSASQANYLSPQICGFVICITYLSTTHPFLKHYIWTLSCSDF